MSSQLRAWQPPTLECRLSFELGSLRLVDIVAGSLAHIQQHSLRGDTLLPTLDDGTGIGYLCVVHFQLVVGRSHSSDKFGANSLLVGHLLFDSGSSCTFGIAHPSECINLPTGLCAEVIA